MRRPGDILATQANAVVPILVVCAGEPANELAAALQAQGAAIERARSAKEVRAALSRRAFAAVVVESPGPTDILEPFRDYRGPDPLPILVVTSAGGYGTPIAVVGNDLVSVDYLLTPLRPEVIQSRLRAPLDLFRVRRALERATRDLERETAARERTDDLLRTTTEDLAARVRESAEARQLAERRTDEFLAALSHEIRNPLAPIRAAVELMRLTGTSDPVIERARGVVDRQVQHLTRLLDDLLDVNRMTHGHLALQTAPAALSDIVAAAVETSRPIIEQRRHRLTMELPDAPVTLEVDAARLAQVLSNLLSNAAKYTPVGGDVQITAALDQRHVVIRVVDSGIGIAADVLPNVFDVFMQGGSARTSGADGLGIGLTLARRFVEMHGGSIHVESKGLGQGATFEVRLPRPHAFSNAPQGGDRGVPASPLPPLRVLVVDDNEDAAEMLVAMLQMWGQETAIAFDGVAAIERGEEFEPEVVLLDIGKPRVDGYETARRIRQRPWGASALLVAVTGWGQQSDRARSHAAGFDRHLVKPVAPLALRSLLAERGSGDGPVE
ncbi:MAG: ATP-binding protein [Acidobacteriota bacterium]